MDARERLRLYLEQRRELGESELMLDGMKIDEVLRVLGTSGAAAARDAALKVPARPAPKPDEPAAAAAEPVWSPAPLVPDDGPSVRPRAPSAPASPAAAPQSRRESAADVHGGDWRATLRAAGAPAPGALNTPPNAAGAPPAGAPSAGDDQPEAREDDMARKSGARRAAGERDGMEESPAPGAATPDGIKGETPPSGVAEPLKGIDAPGGIAVGARDDAEANPFARVRTLDGLAEKIQACTRCDLYKSATHGVPGEGNPEADVVVVGEAPGEKEDLSGRPFVGASGELLTKILAAIKLRREDVFIVNVLKHRPPGNRNPRPDEVEACSPYLVRQLELLQPKVIICFGTFAAQTLLDTKTPIGKLRGAVHRYYGVPLVVTYHPAALLRNPAWKRPAWEDVQLARRILDRPARA